MDKCHKVTLEEIDTNLRNFRREINQKLDDLLTKENKMATVLDALTTAVAANTDVIQSAITLIQGLAQQIKDAGTDPVKLKALTDALAATDQQLAAAVKANTNQGILVSPSTATVAQRGTQQFTATGDTSVTWSVAPADGSAGTVDANGLYTAPSTDGTGQVVATGVTDPTKSGFATVTF